MIKHKSKVSNIQNLTAEQFNKLYPVGTKVKYFPICTDETNYKEAVTTTPAWTLGHGEPVVSLSIGGGGYVFRNIFVEEEQC